MPLFTSIAAPRIVDSIAIILSQAMQLAQAQVSSAASPVLRMMVERDQAVTETDLLHRELDHLAIAACLCPGTYKARVGAEQRCRSPSRSGRAINSTRRSRSAGFTVAVTPDCRSSTSRFVCAVSASKPATSPHLSKIKPGCRARAPFPKHSSRRLTRAER